jgi:methylthioribulose-1-phosphate dehydratase
VTTHDSPEIARAAEALAALTARCASRGWMPATSGNAAARRADGLLWVTASGRDKTSLTARDLVAVDLEGTPLAGQTATPSAETLLHAQLARLLPRVGASVHVHTVPVTVLSRITAGEVLVLEGYELAKAFAGVTTHEARLELPLVPNSQDVRAMAAHVEPYLVRSQPPVAYLIRGHGAYVWGRDVAECERHAEALDFLLTCELWASGRR